MANPAPMQKQEAQAPQGAEFTRARRVFTLSDEVDREHIEAALKNGVLRVTLPKAGAAKTKKISVKAE